MIAERLITLHLPKELAERLDELAALRGSSRCDAIRDLLAYSLANPPPGLDPDEDRCLVCGAAPTVSYSGPGQQRRSYCATHDRGIDAQPPGWYRSWAEPGSCP